MHPRLFRLIEKLQRIDERLRLAQQLARGPEIEQLRSLKFRLKQRIRRFAATPAHS